MYFNANILLILLTKLFPFTALVATYGDVNAAIDRLLGGSRPEGNQQS